MKLIESKRLLIRPAVATDFAALQPIYCCKTNMQYILDGRYRWTEADIRVKWHHLNRRLREGYGLRVVIEKERRRLVGEGGILLLERTGGQVPELGFMLDHSVWGRGLGQELVHALVRFAFYDLQLPRLMAGVRPENAASRHLLEKSGFQHAYSTTNALANPLDYLAMASPLS